jgi:ribosomal protein RSM22 (predicted rRNA methylase)
MLGASHRSAGAALTAVYRAQTETAVRLSDKDKLAYAAMRLPATYAAIHRSLERLDAVWSGAPASLLDAGCGPGTGGLAAAQFWPDIEIVTRTDLDPTWRPLAERLGAASGNAALARGRWLTGAMDQIAFPEHDVVIAAYALNEVPEGQRAGAVRNLWRATRQALVLVEPGTPKGFLNIQAARDALIQDGAFIAAPCPHHAACPMSATDWCHASVRLARSEAHRAAKSAHLPYEDEKFAYLAATCAPLSGRPLSRIVKRPMPHKGHVQLDLCAEGGLSRLTVSRRDGQIYKAARDADWGDGWPPP